MFPLKQLLLVIVLVTVLPASAQQARIDLTQEMVEATNAFVSSLSVQQRNNGVYTFEGTYYTENEGRQPIQFSTTDLNDFYGFIDPEERNDDKKWRNSVILVFYDAVNPEDVEELPQWRMESNEAQLKETLEDICKQTKLTDNDMIQISKTFQNPGAGQPASPARPSQPSQFIPASGAAH